MTNAGGPAVVCTLESVRDALRLLRQISETCREPPPMYLPMSMKPAVERAGIKLPSYVQFSELAPYPLTVPRVKLPQLLPYERHEEPQP